ncbi:MAG: EamA family transporter [Chitinophagaceae bacterium]|nr:EamA family transporter [Chitinophagaceae bacterium]
MQQHKNTTLFLVGFLLALTGAVLFSTKAIIVKVAFSHIRVDALSLLTLRMFFSLPFYISAAWFAARNEPNALTKKQWSYIFILGVFGYYLSSLFDFTGLQYVTAGLERLILFLYPTFVVLINMLLFGQKITATQKKALLLTYAGIAIAYWGELNMENNHENFLWGSLLIFLCAITFSIYIAGSGRLIPAVGATRFTSYAMLAATVGIFIHYAFAGKTPVADFSTVHAGYGVLLAIIATVLPTFMMSNAMKRIGSNNVAIISAIGPVSTIVQAHFILHEHMAAAQWAGTLLVIGGVLLIGWKSNRNLRENQ